MSVRQHPVDDLLGHAHQFSPKEGGIKAWLKLDLTVTTLAGNITEC